MPISTYMPLVKDYHSNRLNRASNEHFAQKGHVVGEYIA